jgi:hypothetical protein
VLLLLLLWAGAAWAQPVVGPAPGYTTIQDEGTAVPRRRILNVTGAGATCTDDTTRTTCDFSAGGGGCANTYATVTGDDAVAATAAGCTDDLDLLGSTDGIDVLCENVAPDSCTVSFDASELPANDVSCAAVSEGAGTDICADLEEETHAAEHSAGAADPITATNLASSCTDAQVLGGTSGGTGVECQTDDDVLDLLGDLGDLCAAGESVRRDGTDTANECFTAGDVTAVGPGCAIGACWTNGVATSGSVLLNWEGTTVDGNDFQMTVPANPSGLQVWLVSDGPGTLSFPTPGNDTLVARATTDTLTNKTIAGGDAGAGTTRPAGSNIVQVRTHNTDCTTLTDGKQGEVCCDEDNGQCWVCIPSAGDCDTAGEWDEVDQTAGGGGGGDTVVRLGSDVTESAGSYTDVTGLSFTAAASTDYVIEANLLYRSAGTTTGISFAVNGPASPTAVVVATQIHTSLANGGDIRYAARAYNSGNDTATVDTANADLPARMQILLRNGTTSGTVIVRVRREVAGSATVTVRAGSVLRYRQTS